MEQLRASFRGDLPALVLGVILVALGSLATLLFCLRWKSRDPTLLSFGVFALLYGVRLLGETPTVWFLLEAPAGFWEQLGAVITYVILIPATFLFLQTVFKGWDLPVGPIMSVLVVFAVLATLSDLVQGRPETAMRVNNLLVIAVGGLSLVALFFPRRKPDAEVQALRIGFLTFGGIALYANLVSAGMLPGPQRLERTLEPLGFLVLVSCLGYVAARRVWKNRERLVALQEEMETARRIQASILPRQQPNIAGLDLAARYVPMSSVGGDFYDFVVVDEKRLGMLVADVSGHGVPAALIASMVKTACASQAAHAADPARLLAGLNQILRLGLSNQFITAAYLFIDVEHHRLAYASAGHPPLLVWRKEDGEVHEIVSNGLMLGPFPQAEYDCVQLELKPGDRCVLYTDGILESRNASQGEFGPGRLKQFLQSQRHLPAAEFSDSLLRRLGEWRGSEGCQSPEDDLTLLVVDYQETT